MSLFGNPPASSSSGSAFNLFSSAARPSSSGNIFGSTTATTGAAGGNIFGAAGRSSLFDNLGTSTSGGATGNPFGNTTTAGAGTTQAQAGSSLLGGQGGGLGQGQQSTSGHGQQQSQQQNQGQSGLPPGSGYFNSLLEKSRKLQREDGNTRLGEFPHIQLGIGDISKKVRELGESTLHGERDRASDSRAHYLLAASGVNVGNTLRDLNELNQSKDATGAAQPAPGLIESAWDPDSHKYVEQLQEQTTLKMIRDGIERAHREFDEFLEENVDMNWDAQRRKIYEHFGLAPRPVVGEEPQDNSGPSFGRGTFGRSSRARQTNGATPKAAGGTRSVFGMSGIQKSVLGTSSKTGRQSAFSVYGEAKDRESHSYDRFLAEKQSSYAEKVQRLNEARLQESVYPILHEFSEADRGLATDTPSHIFRKAYGAIIEVVREARDVHNPADERAVRARQFSTMYLDETYNSQNGMEMRRRILDGSRRAMEKQFFAELEHIVELHAKDALPGGVPTVINRVRAYVRYRVAKNDLVPDGVQPQMLNDDYCWALIYYLLRCGFVDEAVTYVRENSNAFNAIDRRFATFIMSYASNANRRVPVNMRNEMNTKYSQIVRQSPDDAFDPYRAACYKVVGRCELANRSLKDVDQSWESYVWLQLALAREVNRSEEAASDLYDLETLKSGILEIGQKHFISGDSALGYGPYFFMLVLSGQFERAVDWLHKHSEIAAVHFAIALDYYGLLRVSHFQEDPDAGLLTFTTTQKPQIDLARMLGYYTRHFRFSNAEVASDYLALIYLDADLPAPLGRKQADICREALRELVLETREFAQLLGDVRFDGTRVPGAIEQRLRLIGFTDRSEYLQNVTIQAASIADNNGRITDAVLLYHLAEDYENVITIISRTMSDALASDLGCDPLRLAPLRPRDASQETRRQPNEPLQSSLSLAIVDDPKVLAQNFMDLYNSNAMYYQSIRQTTRNTCGILLRISNAREHLEAGRWAQTLDIMSSLDILPLGPQPASTAVAVRRSASNAQNQASSIPTVRAHATAVASLSPPVARLVGQLILWTMTAISQQRNLLLSAEFENEVRVEMRDELAAKAKDLMVFAGLVKLRLGKGVWEGIVLGAGEMGVYS